MFRSLTVATPCHRLATICSLVHCYSATAVCILFTCLFALLCSPCYSTPTTVLGSGPVLTTLHHSHLLCVTPVTCATTSPLRESTLTPCRFHHPYRSLTLAHRVVPPLVVPVPSLAVSGVRLSLMVTLVGESPLADARLRLTPMVTCCSLSARPHIMHHYLPAPLLYAYMSAFLHPCLLTHLPSCLLTCFLSVCIQPCQHNAASIGWQLCKSPQPQFSIYAHTEGAQRASVSEYQAHVCIYAC